MEILLERGRQAARVDSHGAELVSYRDGMGAEYIWQGDARYWAGRNPLLFPTIGALGGEGTTFGGVVYPMERHGFARQREFTVTAQEGHWVQLELCADKDSLAMYPFPFVLGVRHTLLERGFETAITVTNSGAEAMPFCVGGHPAFHCPPGGNENFEDYEIVFEQRETCPTLVPQKGHIDRDCARPWLVDADRFPLRHRDFDQMDTIVLEGLRSRYVALCGTKSGRGVRMDISRFPVLALWTMPEKSAPYLCIEPWHGLPHVVGEGTEFADKAHCLVLDGGETRTLAYTVEPLE